MNLEKAARTVRQRRVVCDEMPCVKHVFESKSDSKRWWECINTDKVDVKPSAKRGTRG